MNWYELILVSGDPVRMTPDQRIKVEPAVLRGDKHIKINGEVIAVSNISKIQETSERYVDDTPPLPPGPNEKWEGKRPRTIRKRFGEDGDKGYMYEAVIRNWAKKSVTKREWNSRYSKDQNFHRLGSEGGLIQVAFLAIVYEDKKGRLWPLSQEMEWCREDEVRTLESTVAA